MMKNKLLLLMTIFLLSGCTAEYNVNITPENASELTTINGLTNENYPVTAYINDQGASETNEKIPGLEYYDITSNADTVNYRFTFPLERYGESTGVNYCYKNVSIYKNENNYHLQTNNFNSCLDFYSDLEQIKVNLHFDENFTITDHNADEAKDNTYTWVINRNNYNNKTLEITYSLKESNKSNIDRASNRWRNIFLIIGCFGVLIIVLISIVKFKNKKMEG